MKPYKNIIFVHVRLLFEDRRLRSETTRTYNIVLREEVSQNDAFQMTHTKMSHHGTMTKVVDDDSRGKMTFDHFFSFS
jgi:hypothetical protein